MPATVKELLNRWKWKPIRNCPGRFMLRDNDPRLTLAALLGHDHRIQEFHSPQATDRVLVVKLEGGGLISYVRSDGRHLHTLNTEEGFYRKLTQLEITLQ